MLEILVMQSGEIVWFVVHFWFFLKPPVYIKVFII